MKTQVAIIGGGPAGMLVSEMLHQRGVASVVLERSSREHVLSRIRAGVLEQTTVEALRAHGLADRLDREGHVHDGMRIVWAGRESYFIDVRRHVGKRFVTYGQTKIQEDLFAAADRRNASLLTEVEDVRLHAVTSDRPYVTFVQRGESPPPGLRLHRRLRRLSRCLAPGDPEERCCASSKRSIPSAGSACCRPRLRLPDIVYANHPRGFALASSRSPTLSRYYIQVPLDTDIADWPDERFWSELKARYPRDLADAIVTGASIEKSIAPLRSYVAEPMQHGRLFLAGDAAHIVPPTGAKGLNLAVSDATYLARALAAFYGDGSTALLDAYGETALRRVWSAVRVSWYLTTLLHRFPGASDFDQRAQEYELEYLRSSHHAQVALAEQYAGLPIEAA